MFPITAILAKADYLITEYSVWHARADTIAEYGPTVITPGAFVQREGVVPGEHYRRGPTC